MSDAVAALFEELQRVTCEEIRNHAHGDLFAGCSDVMQRTGQERSVKSFSQPVVDEWLASAVARATGPWSELGRRLLEATPQLPWIRSYENLESSAELESFRSFYSYQVLAGPHFRGYEPPFAIDELLVGFSLQAPHVFYPSHHHEPPEMYGVISGTLEWQVGGTWTTRGPGDVIVHRSHESHAMRTLSQPALTWVIWPRNPSCHVYMPSLDPPDQRMPARSYT